MSADKLELEDGTLRQRRNLILATIILIFIKHAEVEFYSELKLFGTSATIGNPDFILTFLFLIQAYFLWRFYQYFHADNAYPQLRNQFRYTLRKNLDAAVLNQVFKKLPKGVTSVGGSISYSKLGKPDAGFHELEVEVPTNEGKENKKYTVRIPRLPIELSRIPCLFGFTFRGRILTDFFLPYMLVIYSMAVHFSSIISITLDIFRCS